MSDLLAYGGILEVWLNKHGDFAFGKIIPIRQVNHGVPVIDKKSAAVDLIRYFSAMDFPLSPLEFAKDGSFIKQQTETANRSY